MRLTTIASAFAALLLSASVATAQQINTGSSGSGYWHPFGSTNTATYGESFVAPVGFDQLDQITFGFQNYQNGGALQFEAYVMAWTGSAVTGPILYQSAVTNGTAGGPMTYTFNTGGTTITGGNAYVAFVNASPFIAANPNTQALMQAIGSTNPGGGGNTRFVYNNNGSNFGQLYTGGWATNLQPDMQFSATFSNAVATPEPASMTLMGTGLLAIVGIARRRKTRSAA